MTPDEWNEGMKNEADSVSDALWAQATRRAYWVRLLLPLLLMIVVVSALEMTRQVAFSSGSTSRSFDPARLQLDSMIYPLRHVLAAWWLSRRGLPVLMILTLPALSTLTGLLVGQLVYLPLEVTPPSGGIPGAYSDILPSFETLGAFFREPVGLLSTSFHTLLALLAGIGLSHVSVVRRKQVIA